MVQFVVSFSSITDILLFYYCHVNCLINDYITFVCGLFIDFKGLCKFFTLPDQFYAPQSGSGRWCSVTVFSLCGFHLRMQLLGTLSVQGIGNHFQVFIFSWSFCFFGPISFLVLLVLGEIPEIWGERQAKNCQYSRWDQDYSRI